MNEQLYRPGQDIIEFTKSLQVNKTLGGAIRIGLSTATPAAITFALNVNTFPSDDSQVLRFNQYGIYELDLTGGLGLVQNIYFSSTNPNAKVLIDYLSSAMLQEGVQNEV